ncbi:MAG: C4-dicarboxylate ABC transporter permease [Candidatus Contendobacter odensis]|uniref:TRAP transporter small permease protein n=1 Tax=Candidatus Contendibacter odensensis TaxID=1400860 RepID=A0A2G6PFK8_9GAMM|nr:MAG: C4-dicarboxylate ABC transporter permease [Candidatus Contendobacter odensis]
MFFRLINKAEEAIISLLLVATTLLVFIEVVMRFGFGTGLTWGQELTLHMSAWFVLFGTSYGLKVGAHIGVDAFVRTFSRAGQRLLTLVAVSLCLIYCGLFLYGSWVYLAEMYGIGISMEDLEFPHWMVAGLSEEAAETWKIYPDEPRVPLWLAHGMLLVGFTFLSIRLLELLWSVVTGKATGFHKVDEADESLQMTEELKKEQEQEQIEPDTLSLNKGSMK